jgi:xylose isomerase
VVITPVARMARLLWGSAGLGSVRIGERGARTSPWRGIGGWSAQVAANQEEGDHVHGRLGQECRDALGTREGY